MTEGIYEITTGKAIDNDPIQELIDLIDSITFTK